MDNLVEPLKAGTLVDEYIIEKVLGQGGFGTTYLCLDNLLQRKCVIKEITPHEIVIRAINGHIQPKSLHFRQVFNNALDDFLGEAQKLARFNHPNIVRINRFFSAYGTAYIVMDYEQGVSLREVISQAQDRLSEKEIEAILLPLCDGLRVLHEASLIHRDIKPDNILIRPDGSSVLIDFGAAIDLASISPKKFSVIATPRYAPIEQFDSQSSQGPWIDIYALSATLYELISGSPPLQAMTRIHNDSMRPARDVGRGVYGDRLLGMIDQGLAVDYRERPLCMEDFISRLRIDNNIYLKKVIGGLSEKTTQHFLNWVTANNDLYLDELVAFTVCFPIIDLAWRIGRGMASKELFLSLYRALNYDDLDRCRKLMLNAGFRAQKKGLTLGLIETRVEEYAATYLIDRQSENWHFEFTRKQCARNCLSVTETDVEGFQDLMEDVIDRARGRVKKEFNKAFRRVDWYRVGDEWKTRVRPLTDFSTGNI